MAERADVDDDEGEEAGLEDEGIGTEEELEGEVEKMFQEEEEEEEEGINLAGGTDAVVGVGSGVDKD